MSRANIIPELAPQLIAWRHQIHEYPELAFEESKTAKLVAEILTSHGIEIEENMGGTGIVGTIDSGKPGPTIGLRADMDALPMDEEGDCPHKSKVPGKAHTCGHDGHTVTLVGAALQLAKNPPPKGKVRLIFQPAEETGEGALAMLKDGLLERYPMDEVYAIHNMPLLPKGTAGMRVGPTLSSDADFDITIKGLGGHAAGPHLVVDPIQIGARLLSEISSIPSRYIDPMESASIGVGQFNAGSARNIIPAEATMKGTVRTISKDAQATVLKKIKDVCDGLAIAQNCKIELNVPSKLLPCVNTAEQVGVAGAAAKRVLGADNVDTDINSYPFADDFCFILDKVPGAYFFLGHDGPMVHDPTYRFDDDLLTIGANIFNEIVELRLGDG